MVLEFNEDNCGVFWNCPFFLAFNLIKKIIPVSKKILFGEVHINFNIVTHLYILMDNTRYCIYQIIFRKNRKYLTVAAMKFENVFNRKTE